MTWLPNEIDRYQNHDIYRFYLQDLPQIDFRNFYRPLFNFERQQVGWRRLGYLWVKGPYFCLASDGYKNPAREHLKFDLEKVLAGLFIQKGSTNIHNTPRFHTKFGIVKPIYREGSIADFVGRGTVLFHEIHHPLEERPRQKANEDIET